MSNPANETLYRAFLDTCLHGGELHRIDEFCHPDFTDHTRPAGVPAGLESERDSIAEIRKAFEPVHLHIDHMVSDGEYIATRGRFTGTHIADFMGLVATGREFSIAAYDIIRIVDGRLKEHWGLIDGAALFAALGPSGETGEQ